MMMLKDFCDVLNNLCCLNCDYVVFKALKKYFFFSFLLKKKSKKTKQTKLCNVGVYA